MRISTRTTIERPAAEVWDILGGRFAEASAWASSIEASRAVGEPTIAGAPCRARECLVAVPGADRLVEELVEFDDTAMTLTYALAEGMQHVARSARSTWSVVALGEATSELRVDAEVDLSPSGRALALVLRPYLAGMGRRNADDLKVYAETGGPSRRKQRQLVGSAPLSGLVAANAAFTTASGAALTVGSAWWASQFGDVAEPVVTILGTCLMGYGVCLAWISGPGVGARTGHTLALLDASWVVGTAVVLMLSGREFGAVGLTASVATAAIVAGFGWSQWRASERVHPPSPVDHTPTANDALRSAT